MTSLGLEACETSATVLVTSHDDAACPAVPRPLPTCASPLETPGHVDGYVDAPIATVQATGAVTYAQVDLADGAGPIDLDAMLTEVDTVSSSIALMGASGVTRVYLRGVPLEWLAEMPTGRAVHARFEHGLVVSDRASGRPLLAVRTSGGSTHVEDGIDVGTMHFAQGPARCLHTWAGPGGGGPSTCYLGVVSTGLDVTGASFVSPEQVSLDDHLYRARAVESTRLADADQVMAASGFAQCAVWLSTGFSIVVVGTD